MKTLWTEKEEKLMVDFDKEIEVGNFKKYVFKSPDEVSAWINSL